jgi:adenylate cyclase
MRLPTGLRGRLFLAFAGISSFAILAAVAGLVTFVAARRALEEVTATRMPVTLGAMELMRHSERFVATGPVLLNARNADEISAVTKKKNAQLETIRRHLAQLKEADADSPMIREIGDTIDKLADSLDEVATAVMRRDEATSYRQALLRNAFAASQQFAKIWSVRFEQMQKQVVDLQRTTTSRQTDPGKNLATIDSLDEAMQAMLPLDQLQQRAADSFQLLVGGAETDDRAELARLKAASERAMGDIDGLVSGVDLDISTALLPAIKQLREAALGPGGLFAVREAELNTGADSRRLIAENALLSSRLSEAVEGFVAISRRQMQAASRGAVAVQNAGALALAVIVVQSLACSVLIVWLYVGRNIVSRLTGIGAGMAGIAAGRRDVVVDTDGADEISAMARTLEVFRQNAIERDALLVERAEAAVRLEGLVEERTKELNKTVGTLNDKNGTLEALSVKLSRYLSPQIYRSIFLGQHDDSLITRRKKLTVFFSDIKDFTSTTEDLQPEDLADFLNLYLTEMSRIALAHGATIDKFIGDAIMIFFGDPESRGVKEDAQACVAMAIEMQRCARELQARMADNGFERPFQTRMGINTGYCNVGNFGSSDRMDYTIVGGEVNLAARLQTQCEPDGILVSYETYVLVREMADFEEREPVELKGIRNKVRSFSVLSERSSFDRSRQFHYDQDGLKLSLDLNRMAGSARAEALHSLEGIVNRLRDLPEPASGADTEPPVASAVMASGTGQAGPERESGSERVELDQMSV